MLTLHSGEYPCWKNFSLRLEHDIVFNTGEIVRLSGANGSGKSSFIKQILLPKLLSNGSSFYSVYLEQLFHMQAYVIKAQAALRSPDRILKNSLDCLMYLLDDLEQVQQKEPRPAFIVADESYHLKALIARLEDSSFPYCLVFTIHSESQLPFHYRTICFKPLAQNLGGVNESS